MTLATVWEIGFDFEWLYYISQNWHGVEWINQFFYYLSILGDVGIFWVLVGIVMLFFKKTRKCGVYSLVSIVLVSLLINNILLKETIQRARPYFDESLAYYPNANFFRDFVTSMFPEETFLGFGNIESSYSFPSGHSCVSFTAATMIFLHFKKWGIGAFVLAALIAFSRVFLLVHFPTDILAGAIVGAGGSIGVYYLLNYLQPKVTPWFMEKVWNKVFKKQQTETADETR